MWPNPQETPDLVTFTEEIRNGNFHFLFSDIHWSLCTKVLLSVSKFNTSNVFKKIYWISIKLIETKETQSKLKLPTKTTVFKIKEKVKRELALIPFCCVYFWVQPFPFLTVITLWKYPISELAQPLCFPADIYYRYGSGELYNKISNSKRWRKNAVILLYELKTE